MSYIALADRWASPDDARFAEALRAVSGLHLTKISVVDGKYIVVDVADGRAEASRLVFEVAKIRAQYIDVDRTKQYDDLRALDEQIQALQQRRAEAASRLVGDDGRLARFAAQQERNRREQEERDRREDLRDRTPG